VRRARGPRLRTTSRPVLVGLQTSRTSPAARSSHPYHEYSMRLRLPRFQIEPRDPYAWPPANRLIF